MVPIIIVKVDIRNIGCVVKGDRRGTSKEAEIGGNGGEFTIIVLDARCNEIVLYRREWLPVMFPKTPGRDDVCKIKIKLYKENG